MLTAYRPPMRERRYAGLALTVLVHAALLLGWQMRRQLPDQEAGPEPLRTRIQWIRLPPPAVSEATPASRPERPAIPARPAAPVLPHPAAARTRVAPSSTPPTQAQPVVPAAAPPQNPPQAAPPVPPPAAPSAEQILQRARRDIGAIDRAMRKENNPYIAAPLDSPQIRMRKGMEAAHDMAPPRLWEAPKIEALVNDTGDGARRERVITGNGTYCVTDRGFNTSIDMIEKHGKQMIASCPQHEPHEQPATKQAWRTLRD